MPPTFISYRHEDDEHCARVRELATRLMAEGVSVLLDQFVEECGGPDRGWTQWSVAQAGNSAHKILIVASPGWFRCYEGKEVPGTGLGAAAEARVIEQRFVNAAGVSSDIRIVTFAGLDTGLVPLYLQGCHRFAVPAGFRELVGWLTGAVPVATTPMALADWPEAPPPLLWPVADFRPVREALERFLTCHAPWRFLPLRGLSNTGKTLITEHIFGNALRVPGLACGRFDFKGTTAVHAELLTFMHTLGEPMPDGTSLAERLGHLLNAVKRKPRPILFVFDTYEKADNDAQNWMEKQLLPALIRATWLRVVVAGQRVPERSGAPWGNEACHPFTLTSPPPEEWLTFGDSHREGLTIEFVRQAHELCEGNPSTMATLFGPKN